MKPGMARLVLGATFCAVVATACSSPPPAAPSASQVAGAWVANETLVTASGGECVGVRVAQSGALRDRVFVALSGQSTMSATVTSDGNGTSCVYSGSNQNGALTLTMTRCQASRVPNIICADGLRRDLQLVGGSIQASADSRTGTGSGTETTAWNVTAAPSADIVGVLSVTSTFTWVYLGLPSADYHEFTGTVFPGYADGTITIPADPNPWCLPCGWFH
jgi:hypothetical protein